MTEETLANVDTFSILSCAVKMLSNVYEIDPEENTHDYTINVNAGELGEAIELLLLYVEKYEYVDIQKMFDIESTDGIHFIQSKDFKVQ